MEIDEPAMNAKRMIAVSAPRGKLRVIAVSRELGAERGIDR